MPLRVRTGVCCICVLPAEGSDPPGPAVLGGALLFPEAQTGEGKKNGPPFALPVLPGKAEAFAGKGLVAASVKSLSFCREHVQNRRVTGGSFPEYTYSLR